MNEDQIMIMITTNGSYLWSFVKFDKNNKKIIISDDKRHGSSK
jgi:hypothetical protein